MAARLLREMVRVYTPTGYEHRLVPVLRPIASRLSLEVSLDSADNIVVSDGSGVAPLVLLAGHVDTVEGYEPHDYDGGSVWGRGAVDAKGAIASMIVALALAKSRGYRGCAAVMALSREEGDSKGAWSLVAEARVPPFVIIGEPTGSTGVVIGYRGSVRVEVVCEGSEGHSANPWLYGQATDRLLDSLMEARLRLLRHNVAYSINLLEAGKRHNVTPGEARAVIDIRTPPGVDQFKLVSLICDYALAEGCACSYVSSLAPVKVPLNSPVPRAIVRALKSLGVRPRVSVKMGSSDMNILARLTASIAAYGPGDPSLSHTRRESVTASELGLAALTYFKSIEILCSEGVRWLGMPA